MNLPSLIRMEQLLRPYGDFGDEQLLRQLTAYLELLLRWNERTNLTAIRSPEEIVQRHFGESLFAARHLPPSRTVLDFGSGAGFPGLPLQLLKPELTVTLAESQHKKSAFLREAVRTLAVSAEVWAGRAEDMAATRTFDAVMLRAVDNPALALKSARARVAGGGVLMQLTTGRSEGGIQIPGSLDGVLRIDVC